MSGTKIKNIAMALAVGSAASLLSACGAIDETWEYVSTDNSLRTPTGYYEHTHAVEAEDPMNVPAALSTPYTDKSLDIANVSALPESRFMVGEAMDVRPPVVSRVNEMGVDIRNRDNDALVWFLPYGNMNVRSPYDAWQYLGAALSYLKIPVAEMREQDKLLATSVMSYNEFGQVYRESVDDDNDRFEQVYTVRVVTSPQGSVGLLVSLINSSSDNSSTKILNARQKRSFTMGFANELINALAIQQRSYQTIPDYVEPVLARDNNNQDAIVVNAPYDAVWTVMRGVLSSYGMEITEYSVSRSSIKFKLEEEDAQFYQSQGVRPFGLKSDDYIVRLAVAGNNNTVLTFYDEDDKPLSAVAVATLYNGFSAAISKEFASYKREGANYLAKFSDED